MPLQMIVRENRYTAPALFCDHCGREIEEAVQGHVLYRTDDANQMVKEPATFVHRDCDRQFQLAHPADLWFWQPLPAALIYLERGLQLDRRSARQPARARAAS